MHCIFVSFHYFIILNFNICSKKILEKKWVFQQNNMTILGAIGVQLRCWKRVRNLHKCCPGCAIYSVCHCVNCNIRGCTCHLQSFSFYWLLKESHRIIMQLISINQIQNVSTPWFNCPSFKYKSQNVSKRFIIF